MYREACKAHSRRGTNHRIAGSTSTSTDCLEGTFYGKPPRVLRGERTDCEASAVDSLSDSRIEEKAVAVLMSCVEPTEAEVEEDWQALMSALSPR